MITAILRLTIRAVTKDLPASVLAAIATVPASVAIVQRGGWVADAVAHRRFGQTIHRRERGPHDRTHRHDVGLGYGIHRAASVGKSDGWFRDKIAGRGAHDIAGFGLIAERWVAHARTHTSWTFVSRNGGTAGGDVCNSERGRRAVYHNGGIVTPSARRSTHETIGGATRATALPPQILSRHEMMLEYATSNDVVSRQIRRQGCQIQRRQRCR